MHITTLLEDMEYIPGTGRVRLAKMEYSQSPRKQESKKRSWIQCKRKVRDLQECKMRRFMLVTKMETRICKKAIVNMKMRIYNTSFLRKSRIQVTLMNLKQMRKNKIAVVHFEFQREVCQQKEVVSYNSARTTRNLKERVSRDTVVQYLRKKELQDTCMEVYVIPHNSVRKSVGTKDTYN